jgi:hypothetical protein
VALSTQPAPIVGIVRIQPERNQLASAARVVVGDGAGAVALRTVPVLIGAHADRVLVQHSRAKVCVVCVSISACMRAASLLLSGTSMVSTTARVREVGTACDAAHFHRPRHHSPPIDRHARTLSVTPAGMLTCAELVTTTVQPVRVRLSALMPAVSLPSMTGPDSRAGAAE